MVFISILLFFPIPEIWEIFQTQTEVLICSSVFHFDFFGKKQKSNIEPCNAKYKYFLVEFDRSEQDI